MSISNQNKILKIGNAPCSWGIYYPKNNYLKYDKYIKKISEIGYQYSELGPLGYFNDEINIIKDHLNKNNINISGAAHVHSFAKLSNFDELKSEINKISKILLKLDSSNLIIMDDSNFYFKNISRKINIHDWKIIMQNLIQIKTLTENEYGINLHFHPHVGTFIEYENQIDKLLNDTDISICFDTGHHAFWKQNALNYLKKIFNRVGYIHLKNVNDTIRQMVWNNEISIEQSYENGVMAPLENGYVNINNIITFLLKKEFSGFCIIEQDPEKTNDVNPDNLAKKNLLFVENIIDQYNNQN